MTAADPQPKAPHMLPARERLAHLRGALRLTRAGIDLAADVAEQTHQAIAAAPLAVVGRVPMVRLYEGIHRGIFTCVRLTNRLLFGGLDRALALAGPALAPRAALPGPLLGLLHGVLGDHLTRARNPLRTAMHLRHAGRRLSLAARSLADLPPARIVVFVHGLAADESCWRRGADRSFGRPDTDYGDQLATRGDITPLYLRYNSGLRIAANGRALADLLRRLHAALPGPPRQLVLVGHSMGGLVVRSACHHGRARGDAWTDHVTDIACLGAPHRGAVLERLGAAAVAALTRISVTAPIARALDLRSAGIKDLARGTTHDDPGPEHRLTRARYHDLAGTLQARPLAWVLGDGLVHPTSAAPDDPTSRRTVLPGVDHLAMLAHPGILAWLTTILDSPPTD